jgi:RNA polymerase sigma factor (sigma-70 family)
VAANHHPVIPVSEEPPSVEASYRQYRAELIVFFLRRTRERANVEDLVQQVYERLLKYRPRAPVTDPKGYLFQTARHVLISANHAARQHQERYVACDANDLATRAEGISGLWVEEEGGAELAFEEFERVLNELPVNCRAALLRQRRDGWSYQQIAQELDVSVNTVKDYIVKALQHFQVHFSLPAKHASALKGRR